MKQQLMNSIPPSLGSKPTHDQVAAIAYHLYLEHGCPAGHDLENWLLAEYFLTQRMRETEKFQMVHSRPILEESKKVRPVPPHEHPFARDQRGSASREEIRQKTTQLRPAARQPQWRTSRPAQSTQIAA